MQTNSNGKTSARWFDIGAEGGKVDGTVMEAQARSCWLRDVTGVWFLFNSHDTTETRDCYSQVERVALRYVDEDRRIRFLTPTEKMADLSIGGWHRGGSKRVFRLSDGLRSPGDGGEQPLSTVGPTGAVQVEAWGQWHPHRLHPGGHDWPAVHLGRLRNDCASQAGVMRCA